MSYTIELSDEQYTAVKHAAETLGQTPAELFAAWALEAEARYRREHPTYYETEDWLRHLGASDEDIEDIKREIREEAEMPYDADA